MAATGENRWPPVGRTECPLTHDPHETRIAGWTGIDARPLVPSNKTDQISGIMANNGQILGELTPNGLLSSDFTSDAATVGGNLLTAQVKPGSYLLLLGRCEAALPDPVKTVRGLYEAEVTSGSHAVPVPVRAGSIGIFDSGSGALGPCPASPGTGPPVSPAPTPTSS
jgi:hypothetical protein